MATVLFSSTVSCSSFGSKRTIAAKINVPKNRGRNQISLPTLPDRGLVAELDYLKDYPSATTSNPITTTTTHVKDDPYYFGISINAENSRAHGPISTPSSMEVVKLHLIMEIVADRLEMHKNVGVQRDNWNRLLLTSVNMMTLSAASMAGLAAIGSTSSIAPLVTLKVSSTILYLAAAGLLAVMNHIQPSQLAEEQRNAARLFKHLHEEIRTKISLGNPTVNDVNEAMEKVLALDRAYPLPLLGAMLDKFPKTVEPAVWWPRRKQRYGRREEGLGGKLKLKGNNYNGWDARLEEEMKDIVRVLKKKDMAEYLRLSKKALNFNKIMAVSGPLLTGLAALGSAFIGSNNADWAVMVGVIGGALASVVNTLEHGGQAGMVFELYRGTAGFFKLMEETIKQNINEQDLDKRENGELFEIKMALQLGRSLSELRQFAALSSSDEENADDEFVSKVF